jgi:tetratricopeptide (TPR) repeat protein
MIFSSNSLYFYFREDAEIVLPIKALRSFCTGNHILKLTQSLANLSEKLTQLRTLVSNLAITLVSIALVIVLVRQLLNTSTLIEPIQVPVELSEIGLTSEVSAQWLIDNILEIQQQAPTRKEGKVISPEWQQLDMEVPGSGLSVKTIGSVIRESLGMVERKVAIEVIDTGKQYLIRIRQSHSQQPYLSETVQKQDVQALFSTMAKLAVKQIDPFMYASYLYGTEQFENLDSALEYSKKYTVQEDKKWTYNLLAMYQAESGLHEDAEANYNEAIKLDPEFAIAYSNRANLLDTSAKLKRKHEALHSYLSAIDADESFIDDEREAISRLARARWLARNPSSEGDALEMYQVAAKKDPKLYLVNLRLGKFLMDTPNQEYRLAIKQFKSIPDLAKEKYASLLFWGDALLELDNCPAAVEKYCQAKTIKEYGAVKKLKKIDELGLPGCSSTC